MIKDSETIFKDLAADELIPAFRCINYNQGVCMKRNIKCWTKYSTSCFDAEYYTNLKEVH